ncbi:MAG: hypothetical protein GKR87_08055 [Kiritimatiellae bacterium]|nr:hypothetical protein [Kiritimatiellia bacterium]
MRVHEAAQGMAAGDLNNDGFQDLVVTHAGGGTIPTCLPCVISKLNLWAKS